MLRLLPRSTLFPYTTLFRSRRVVLGGYNRRSRSAQDFPPGGKSNHDKVRGGLGAKPPKQKIGRRVVVGGYNRRSRSAQDFPLGGKSNHDKVRGGVWGRSPRNKGLRCCRRPR